MKWWAVAGVLALCGFSGQAGAVGCLSGAAVGGIAGHMAGHGVLGAGAGCAIGHHEAVKEQKRAAAASAQNNVPPSNQPDHSPESH
ncbi:MAG: hypothetical protein JO326_07010 [Acetobacteraceae bacterium]|nr:hypothetical protein [Acetobacteraceae bacterium]